MTLAFAHPATGEHMRFDAPLPPDFVAARAALAAGRLGPTPTRSLPPASRCLRYFLAQARRRTPAAKPKDARPSRLPQAGTFVLGLNRRDCPTRSRAHCHLVLRQSLPQPPPPLRNHKRGAPGRCGVRCATSQCQRCSVCVFVGGVGATGYDAGSSPDRPSMLNVNYIDPMTTITSPHSSPWLG